VNDVPPSVQTKGQRSGVKTARIPAAGQKEERKQDGENIMNDTHAEKNSNEQKHLLIYGYSVDDMNKKHSGTEFFRADYFRFIARPC